jgi:nucleoside-diphosphate-sugar epimerase
MHTLAITGASGFLGRHLICGCLAQGGFKLKLLLRDGNTYRSLLNENVSICEGDLLAPESLRGFLEPNSTLIHLAYIHNDPSANIKATINLIGAARQSSVKRVVHCSSAVVVGFKAGGVITEDIIPSPEGEYQKIKYKIEEMLRAGLLPEVELAILRPTEIIGPGGQGLQKMIQRLRCGRSHKNFIYHSILKYRRCNYVSVYNVVAALLLLASTPVKQMGQVYNISDDDDPDNNYAAVEKIINSGFQYKYEYALDFGFPRTLLAFLFRLLPTHSPPDRIYAHSKISSLGYRKAITLNSAISEILLKEAANAHS